MPLNKWRYVEYYPDSCGVYQCLNCRRQWVTLTPPQKYCQYCGTKWDGEHKCVAHDNRKKSEFTATSSFYWVVEERISILHDTTSYYVVVHNWKVFSIYDGRWSAKYVLEKVNIERAYKKSFTFLYEYRITTSRELTDRTKFYPYYGEATKSP